MNEDKKGPQKFLQAFAIIIVFYGLLHVGMMVQGYNIGVIIPLSLAVVGSATSVVITTRR